MANSSTICRSCRRLFGAKALLDRWQIEQQNTRNLLESINFTLQTAISHTHQQACEMAATIKALETTTEVQTRDIQETVTQSYEVISAQIKGFNEQYSRKIEAEYQISTNILKNTAENLRGINDVTKQVFGECNVLSTKASVFAGNFSA